MLRDAKEGNGEDAERTLVILERKHGESSSEYAKRILEYNIVHLKLLPGEQLQEKMLSEQIGVSRTPIREAILELKRRDIINIYPQHGSFVSYLDNKHSEDIRFLRYVFESELAAQACRLRNDQQIDYMQENVLLQKLYLIRSPDRFMLLDSEFHGAIYKMCGRENLHKIIMQHSTHFDRIRRLSYSLDSSRELIDEHALIADAIEARDEETARGVCQRHLMRAIADGASLKARHPNYYSPSKG